MTHTNKCTKHTGILTHRQTRVPSTHRHTDTQTNKSTKHTQAYWDTNKYKYQAHMHNDTQTNKCTKHTGILTHRQTSVPSTHAYWHTRLPSPHLHTDSQIPVPSIHRHTELSIKTRSCVKTHNSHLTVNIVNMSSYYGIPDGHGDNQHLDNKEWIAKALS